MRLKPKGALDPADAPRQVPLPVPFLAQEEVIEGRGRRVGSGQVALLLRRAGVAAAGGDVGAPQGEGAGPRAPRGARVQDLEGIAGRRAVGTGVAPEEV